MLSMYTGDDVSFYDRKRSYIEESLFYPYETKRVKTEPLDTGYEACNSAVTMNSCSDMYLPEQYRPLDYRVLPQNPYCRYQNNVLRPNNLFSTDSRIASGAFNSRMSNTDTVTFNGDVFDLDDSEVFTINSSDFLELSEALFTAGDATTLVPDRPVKKSTSRKRSEGNRGTKSTTTYTTVPLPPCKVCGGVATGFHFGVITCEACKAFFRRALIHKQDYKCLKEDNCDIVDKKLGNCSACRLKKCFALGMSKGGVRRGRYSIAIRTKAIIEAKALEGKEAATMTPQLAIKDERGEVSPDSDSSLGSLDGLLYLADLSPKPKKPTFVRNNELEYLIDTLMSCQEALYPQLRKLVDDGLEEAQYKIYEEFSIKEEAFGQVFGKTNTISTEEYQQIFAETGIDLDDRLLHFNKKGKSMEENIAQYVNFAKVIPGFKNIHPKDVAKLLKAAHYEFWIYGNYRYMNKDLEVCGGSDGVFHSKKLMSKFFEDDFSTATMDFANTLSQMKLTLEEMAFCRVIVLTYTASHMEFWIFGTFRALNKDLGVCGGPEGMIPCNKNHIKLFFGDSWVNTTLDFADSLKQLDITLEEISIIRVILLTYTDRCELLEREKIQRLQEKFVECLEYHLTKTCSNPGKRLAQIFDRMLAVRDLTQLNINVNMKFLKEWGFVMHDYPLWKEMLSWNEI